MSTQVVSNGTVTINTSALRFISDISFNKTFSGSNAIGTIDNITTSSYQALQTSSLSDIRYFVASNEDLTASIAIATDSSGTNRIGYLGIGDSLLMPWSGSTQLYAKAFNSTASAMLEYALVES